MEEARERECSSGGRAEEGEKLDVVVDPGGGIGDAHTQTVSAFVRYVLL